MPSSRLSPRSAALVLTLVAALFAGVHLIRVPASLEDVDSINLALGLNDFDVSRHQPHPPGYPVFIALARLAKDGFAAAGATHPVVRGLAFWGAIGGALAVVALFRLFRQLRLSSPAALAGSVIVVMSPLFWFTASRPLTDVAGLAAALAVQTLALSVLASQRDPDVTDARVQRRLVWTAVLAGLAIGVRSQTFLLTLPILFVLAWVPGVPAARRSPWAIVAGLVVGVMLWTLPLFSVSGGAGVYLRALGDQAAEDFHGVRMLATHPGARAAAFAVIDTFVRPWGSPILATVILAMAALGGVVLFTKRRWGMVALLLLLWGPYLAFHLAFQETVTVRYALPLVVPVVALAAMALDALRAPVSGILGVHARWVVWAPAAAVVTASLMPTSAALRAYATEPSPTFRAVAAVSDGMSAASRGPVLLVHNAVRRAVQWTGLSERMRVLPVTPNYEWLSAVDYWRRGGDAPVWFLARPVRTDIALFDPRSVRRLGHYEWPFDTSALAGGMRPNRLEWYEIDRPGWVLERGWSLTPETAGMATADGAGPLTTGSRAFARRRDDAVTLMVGGRQLGEVGCGAAMTLMVDGREVAAWTQAPGAFVKVVELPAGTLSGDGRFAELTVRAAFDQGGGSVYLEQFDLAPSGEPMVGFGEGWMEPEFDQRTRRLWRWASNRSVLQLPVTGRDVALTVVGESPVRQLGRAPKVTVRAGGTVVDSFEPDGAFEREIRVPAEALAAASGDVVVEADQTFVPDEQSSNGDRRTLSLRVFKVLVR